MKPGETDDSRPFRRQYNGFMGFNRKVKWLALPVFLLICIAVCVIWRPRQPQPLLEITCIPELENYLEELTHSGFPPGLSLAVVKNDSVVYQKVLAGPIIRENGWQRLKRFIIGGQLPK